MEFRILGSLEVRAGGAVLPLKGLRERTILAVLLLDAGRMVPVTRLVDAAWPDDPPETAVKQVRNAVSRLRAAFAVGGSPGAIQAEGNGYRLDVPGGDIDVRVFEAQVREAERAGLAGEPGLAAATLRSALALWRGPMLAGLSGPVVEAASAAWDERRRSAQDSYYEHMLALGGHAEIIPELSTFLREDRLREKTAAQLMLALYRSGRQGDALAVYRDLSAALADRLGLDPGADLHRLHQQILTRDPALGLASASQDRAEPDVVVPRQLPAATRHFAGRADELSQLDALLSQAPPATVIITAIGGTAGIGKTALAVHWAHRVASRFPDGQLYVNLRGFDPSAAPAEPAEVIRGFLDALSVPADRVPVGLDARAALYRSLLAGRRMLVLLDNARDPAQVRPLLPGSVGCLAVVTSRRKLTSLVAAEGAQPVTLGLLSAAEARELLVRSLGADRVTRNAAAADELAGLCARLPLALSITTARAATDPARPLDAFTAELRDARGRLDALSTGDPDVDVRAVFSWSYDSLSPAAARVFRLLGLHPGPDFSLPATASLAGLPAGQARGALTELAAAHLLAEHVPGRYVFHDLLRAYAAEQAQATDGEAGRRAAAERLLDHCLHSCVGASAQVRTSDVQFPLEPPASGTVVTEFASPAAAQAWFAAEMDVLDGAIRLAEAGGFDVHAWKLPWAMTPWLNRLGYWDEWKASHHIALAAAERLGDLHAQGIVSRDLARALIRLGELQDADEHLRRALGLYRQLGQKTLQGKAHESLGDICLRQGRPLDALAHARQSLRLYQEAGNGTEEAVSLANVGWCLMLAGDLRQAQDYYQRSLARYRELGHHRNEAHTWNSLGHLHHQQGNHREAITSFRHALSLLADDPDRGQQADALNDIGDAHHALGEADPAVSYWGQALAILDELGSSTAADAIRVKLTNATVTG